MSDFYTLCARDKDDNYTPISAGLTARQAAMAIIGDDGQWQPELGVTDHRTDDGAFRCFKLRRHHLVNSTTDRYVITATVPMTEDAAADEEAAWPLIEAQVLSDPKMYCKVQVFTDTKWAQHLEKKAEREHVAKLDRVIITALVTALVNDKWTIRGNLLDDDPGLKRSTNIHRIVSEFTGCDMVEFVARRGADRAWARLVLGESGWDVIQDYSVSIEPYVDAATRPHLPADAHHGFADVYMLPAQGAAEVAEIDRAITALMDAIGHSVGD